MAGIHTVTALFNQLNDMITKFRLHDLGNFLRILQAECYIRIGRIHHTASHKSTLTTFDGRSFILRIQTRQCREVNFPFCHTVCVVTQFLLHIFNFRDRNLRLQRDNLHFHLCRDIRNAILRKVFEVTAYFRRSHLDLSHQFLLHLLHCQPVTRIITQSFANLCRSLIEVFLHFFF